MRTGLVLVHAAGLANRPAGWRSLALRSHGGPIAHVLPPQATCCREQDDCHVLAGVSSRGTVTTQRATRRGFLITAAGALAARISARTRAGASARGGPPPAPVRSADAIAGANDTAPRCRRPRQVARCGGHQARRGSVDGLSIRQPESSTRRGRVREGACRKRLDGAASGEAQRSSDRASAG